MNTLLLRLISTQAIVDVDDTEKFVEKIIKNYVFEDEGERRE